MEYIYTIIVIYLGCAYAFVSVIFICYLQRENKKLKKERDELLHENLKLIGKVAKLIQPSDKKVDYQKANNVQVNFN